jgi:predicted transcriptional regulator
MLEKLPPRERELIDLLYERGPLTVAEFCDLLPDRLSGSAVRAMLKRLEDKGLVRRKESDRGFLFSPTLANSHVRHSALGHVVQTFFSGSAVSAASALLGMAKRMSESELNELEALIARARKSQENGK